MEKIMTLKNVKEQKRARHPLKSLGTTNHKKLRMLSKTNQIGENPALESIEIVEDIWGQDGRCFKGNTGNTVHEKSHGFTHS